MKNLSRYQHVMLDMETLSIADNPVVLSISAIAFDIAKINNLDDFKRPANGQIRDDISFHCALEMDDQIKRGLDYNNSTLLWHLNHNEKFFRECLGQKGSTIPILVPVAALEEVKLAQPSPYETIPTCGARWGGGEGDGGAPAPR